MKKNKKAKKLFIAYLAVMVPINGAMAADWQAVTPSETLPAAKEQTIGTIERNYFQITSDDVALAVSKQMMDQGFKQKVSATLAPELGKVIYGSNHPLKLAVHALQVDTNARVWQAQAYMIHNGVTESVKPISGRYDAMARVPVLTRQLRQGDTIEQGDIVMREIPERQLRKDTILNAETVIGLSPKRIISSNRPLRANEIAQPTLVKKGQSVEMTYSTPYMSIRANGEALESGAHGDMIRVKNEKSDKAVSARVAGAGHVEVNSEAL